MPSVLPALVIAAVTCLGPIPAQPTTQANGAKPSGLETASQFYMRYRIAVLDASSIDDVLAFWRTELVDDYKQRSPDQRVDLAEIKRIYRTLKDVKVVGETVGAAGGATLTLEGTGPEGKKMQGTAYIVTEDGEWKLYSPEDWRQPE